MQDPSALITVAGTAVAGLSLTSVAALKGWQQWLDLRRLETDVGGRKPASRPSSSFKDVADLRARIRRLEAIADGIEP